MTRRRGISLLELLPIPAGAATLVPNELAEKLNLLSVLQHRSTTSDSVFMHYGTVQSISDDFDLGLENNRYVEFPGITTGLPFRILIERRAVAAGEEVEQVGVRWKIDLYGENLRLRVPFFNGAN